MKIEDMSKEELLNQKAVSEDEIAYYRKKGADELINECEAFLKEVCDELNKRD